MRDIGEDMVTSRWLPPNLGERIRASRDDVGWNATDPATQVGRLWRVNQGETNATIRPRRRWEAPLTALTTREIECRRIRERTRPEFACPARLQPRHVQILLELRYRLINLLREPSPLSTPPLNDLVMVVLRVSILLVPRIQIGAMTN